MHDWYTDLLPKFYPPQFELENRKVTGLTGLRDGTEISFLGKSPRKDYTPILNRTKRKKWYQAIKSARTGTFTGTGLTLHYNVYAYTLVDILTEGHQSLSAFMEELTLHLEPPPRSTHYSQVVLGPGEGFLDTPTYQVVGGVVLWPDSE